MTPTAGRRTPCGSSRATPSQTRSSSSTEPPQGRRKKSASEIVLDALVRAAGPRFDSLEFRQLLAPIRRRLQRDRLRPQQGRHPPRPEAGQRHARPVRRDAGRRLGAGEGRRRCRTLASGGLSGARAATVPRPKPATFSARRATCRRSRRPARPSARRRMFTASAASSTRC